MNEILKLYTIQQKLTGVHSQILKDIELKNNGDCFFILNLTQRKMPLKDDTPCMLVLLTAKVPVPIGVPIRKNCVNTSSGDRIPRKHDAH